MYGLFHESIVNAVEIIQPISLLLLLLVARQGTVGSSCRGCCVISRLLGKGRRIRILIGHDVVIMIGTVIPSALTIR